MIDSFDDFCLWVYVMVDDVWRPISPLFKRRGPHAECSDSELLMTMALVGECRGWVEEPVLLSNWQEHRDLFPRIPWQSRFNRRRRTLMNARRSWQDGIHEIAAIRRQIDNRPIARRPGIQPFSSAGEDGSGCSYQDFVQT